MDNFEDWVSDISRYSLYSYNYWPFNIEEPVYDSPQMKWEDIPLVSLWYYNYWPIREKEPVVENSIQHEYRISILETKSTTVLTTPYFDVENIAAGKTVRISTKSESLLNPKRKVGWYRVVCEDLDIDKAWTAYSDGSISIPVSIPKYAKVGSEIEIGIQAFDDLGNRSRMVRNKIKITLGYVKTPEIIQPESGDVVYFDCLCGVKVKTDKFETDGFPDVHDYTDWKITDDELGFNRVEAKLRSKELTEFTFIEPRMKEGKSYYIWARHHGRYLGYSDWGMVRVIGWNVEVNRPVIKTEKTELVDLNGYSMWDYVNEPLEEDSSSLNKVNIRKENLIVEAGEFSITGCEDTQYGMRWRISEDIECKTIIYETIVEGNENICSFPMLPEMKNKEPFFVSCKYISQNYGESEWSLPVKFIPEMGTILPPAIIKPEEGDLIILNDGLKLEASEFMTQHYEDEYTGTEWKICEDRTGNSILVIKKVDEIKCELDYSELKNLESDTVYYIFASHYDKVLSPSDWSEPVAIQTYLGGIRTPKITSPVNGELYLPESEIEVSSNEFGTTHIVDTHQSTDWKITEDKLGEYPVVEDLDSEDLTEHTFTGLNLTSGKRYYIWVRYNGESEESSNWSESIEVRVISGKTEVCSIIEPDNGSIVVINMEDLKLKTSPYLCEGESDKFSKTEWKICNDGEGENSLIESEDESLEIVIPASELQENLEDGEIYYVFARHKGTLYEIPEWSEPISIEAKIASIVKPEIIAPKNHTILNSDFTIVSSSFKTVNHEDNFIQTGWKITNENGDLVKQWNTDSLSVEADMQNGICNISCQHKGEKLGWSGYGNSIKVYFKNNQDANTRSVYRHSSNMGSVVEFNDNGIWRKVLVADAQYRFISKWGDMDYKADMDTYVNKNTNSNQYIDGVSRTGSPYPTVSAMGLTENVLNNLWQGSLDKLTSRECCEIWLKYADPIAVWKAREVNLDGVGFDIPNFQTMLRIFCEAQTLDSLDASLPVNERNALGLVNIYGWWHIGGTDTAWTSTQFSMEAMRTVNSTGDCMYSDKDKICAVIPVLELD